ncbi:MAG TPA: 4Fe-4S dicluster domain-containing protein [Gammaproteobacteria bacterium]|nr:4Fe-4S dicluster domain-containing protein [Gammaproteobacteria bacterium]
MDEPLFLPAESLQALVDALQGRGFRCVGPRVQDGAVVYGRLDDAGELPHGMRDEQGPGRYRLRHEGDGRRFAWANGPQALKPFLFAPEEPLWRSRTDADGPVFEGLEPDTTGPLAVIGARACDLAALDLQDRHFLGGPGPDPHYQARREGLFLVAVDCSHPAETCFCVSTGDGPQVTAGHDLALHELGHGYVVRSGTERGAEVAAALPVRAARHDEIEQAGREVTRAVRAQHRRLPSRDLRSVLFSQLEHPQWQRVAERCLACGNCTSVCPTCFCHSEHDQAALDGSESLHLRQWDSCFTEGHSYLHGVVIRAETAQRYRQWLTHKLGSWHDQFGRSGCVGCGRCIAWCPVGIDLTEEVAALCHSDEEACE